MPFSQVVICRKTSHFVIPLHKSLIVTSDQLFFCPPYYIYLSGFFKAVLYLHTVPYKDGKEKSFIYDFIWSWALKHSLGINLPFLFIVETLRLFFANLFGGIIF